MPTLYTASEAAFLSIAAASNCLEIAFALSARPLQGKRDQQSRHIGRPERRIDIFRFRSERELLKYVVCYRGLHGLPSVSLPANSSSFIG